MKSMFDVGFRPQFMPMSMRRLGLGQDDSGIITSYDQGPSSSGDIPGLYTSVDQGPPSSGNIPGLVTQQDLQSKLPATPGPASSATDWGKVLADMAKAGATTYAGYTKAQIADAAAKQKAGLPTGLPKTVPPPSSISPNTIFLVGGLAAVAIIAAIAAG